MIKIAIVVDGQWEYPIFRIKEKSYCVYIGGALGMSDPLHFERDTEAIAYLQREIPINIHEM